VWRTALPKDYIAGTLVKDRLEVPMRALNATCSEQKLMKGPPVAHCEPVTLATLCDVKQPQVQDITLKLQNVIAGIKPNLSDAESRELEELLTEYGVIFVMKSADYDRTKRVYHCIDMGEARPICQPSSRLPVAKKAYVG
jgi:hypothetical protein